MAGIGSKRTSSTIQVMDGSELDSSTIQNEVRTMILLGRAGNGKSATGNSILGRRAFKSKSSSSGVTKSSELQKTIMKNGEIINVIDTPGLFDLSVGFEVVSREIAKCINMAKDGIHAVLLVLSVKNRFTKEEKEAVKNLRALFGSKIYDYMIVVFTGGDELEDNDETLEDYLGDNCPKPLKDILTLCNNRRVLFDNKTRYEFKKKDQVQQLLSLVNEVIAQNNGQPYTNELFAEIQKVGMKLEPDSWKEKSKKEIYELKEQMNRLLHEEQMKRVTDAIESKLRESTMRLELQLKEEQDARRKLEEMTRNLQEKTNDEVQRLRKKLAKAKKKSEKLRKKTQKPLLPCPIM